MLRRNSSKRLDRRKSTSSVHSKHDSIDPEVARQHAHVAATNVNPQLQRKNSSTTQRDRQSSTEYTNNENKENTGLRRQQSVRFAGPSAVQRRQSIGTRTKNPVTRQTSSTALRPVAMTTSAPVPAMYRPPSRSSSLGKALTGNTNTIAGLMAYDEYYTLEDDVASTPSSYRRIRKSKSMFTPLCAPDIYYTNGTPGGAESSYTGPLSNISNSQTLQTQSTETQLRAPKSMSFLRGGRDFRQSISGERNDVAVQMARDRFFQQAAQQRLREQPSFLFRSKTQRQEKPFRKSVRSGSGTQSGSQAIGSEDQQNSTKESKLKEKARHVSRSLRSKLKRVFGRSKDEPVAIPNQQVDALQTHVRGYHGDADNGPGSYHNIPHPDDATLSRVSSRVPSLHNAHSSQQLKSRAGSIKSTTSNKSDDKSRVTSWNTGVSTITSQVARTQSEREQQRLSIINENGTYVPSSSFTRPRLPFQFNGSQVQHKSSKSLGHPPATARGAIDSARVYSALMKRLDENSPKAKLDATRKASGTVVTPQRQYRARSTSANTTHSNHTPATIRQVSASQVSNSGSDGIASTVNYTHKHQWVTAKSYEAARVENLTGQYGDTHIHQWVQQNPPHDLRPWNEDDVFSSKDVTNQPRNASAGLRRGESKSSKAASGLSHKLSTTTSTSYHTVPESSPGLTPQEMALRNEPVVPPRRGLRETRSTFFGSSSVTIAKTPSPYRRALAIAETDGEGDYNPAVVTGNTPVPAIIRHSAQRYPLTLFPETDIATHAEYSGEHAVEPAYSESVYSRTTGGRTPGAADSALSLLLNNGIENQRAITALEVSKPNDTLCFEKTSYQPTMPSQQARAPSSTGSYEWKLWMSSEVARLERGKENIASNSGARSGDIYVNYAFPSLASSRGFSSVKGRHVREKAQIYDDESDGERRKEWKGGVKMPLGEVVLNRDQNSTAQIAREVSSILLKPILKNGSKTSLRLENMDPASTQIPTSTLNQAPTNPPPPPPPPISPRSPLRNMLSQASFSTIKNGTPHQTKSSSAPNSASKTASIKGRNVLHKKNLSSATLRSVSSRKSDERTVGPARLVKRQRQTPGGGGQRGKRVNTPSPGVGLSWVGMSLDGEGGGRMGSDGRKSDGRSERSRSRTPGQYYTPGMFRMVSGGLENRRCGDENKKEREEQKEHSYEMGEDFIDVGERGRSSEGRGEERGKGMVGDVKQDMGSRRMVDLFLKSRRKRVGSVEQFEAGYRNWDEGGEEGENDRNGDREAGAVFL